MFFRLFFAGVRERASRILERMEREKMLNNSCKYGFSPVFLLFTTPLLPLSPISDDSIIREIPRDGAFNSYSVQTPFAE